MYINSIKHGIILLIFFSYRIISLLYVFSSECVGSNCGGYIVQSEHFLDIQYHSLLLGGLLFFVQLF